MSKILQRQLKAIVKLKESITEASAQLRDMKGELARQENDVYNALLAGIKVEAGPFTASIEERLPACRPPWKEVYLGHMAELHGQSPKAVEEQVRQLYPPEVERVLVVGKKS